MTRTTICASTLILFSVVLSGCGDKKDADYNNLRAYEDASPYSEYLVDCIRPDNDSNELCSLNKLPLLGLEVANPSVQDIMNRVAVSHDWMAVRFEDVLNALPPEVLPLFSGLTGVVIDDDIRPSFYTSSTGAIYLDPAYLWLTVEEKRTISTDEDPRGAYNDPLNFRSVSRYVQNGEYYVGYSSLEDDQTRPFSDSLLLLSRLLLHELAHVNDFIPPSSYDELDTSLTVGQVTSAMVNQRISNTLASSYPLSSPLLYSLADVMYFGVTPDEALRDVDALEVADEFEPEGASDHYAYATQYEDAAMLFENTMMKYLYDIDYELAFTDAPEDERYCNYYIIRWGQRSRIGDSEVKERAQYIVGEILPELQTELFFQNLEPPAQLPVDGDWCAIQPAGFSSGSSPQKTSRSTNQAPQPIPQDDLLRPYR